MKNRSLYLSFYIGLRYHRSSNKKQFLSLLSWVSLLGMVLGVAALIIVLSVMNGFQSEIRSRLLSVMAHGLIVKENGLPIEHWQTKIPSLENLEGLEGVAPWVGGDAMLSTGSRIVGIELNGINPESEGDINDLSLQLIRGDYVAFRENPYSILLGLGLARTLGVEIGQKVTLNVPRVLVTPFGLKPRVRQLEVAGLFEVGADVDATAAFIHLETAQKLMGYRETDAVDAFRFKTRDLLQIEHAVARMNTTALLSDLSLTAVPWTQLRQQLFNAIKMEKMMVALMLTLVIAVAAFNLISMMTMMVADKRNEIAVLKMMGLCNPGVLSVFLIQGLSLSFVSVLIGGVLGVLIAFNLNSIVRFLEDTLGFYIFDPTVFYISGLPSQVIVSDVVYVVYITLLLSLIFVAYPAFRATRVKPVEALQYQ